MQKRKYAPPPPPSRKNAYFMMYYCVPHRCYHGHDAQISLVLFSESSFFASLSFLFISERHENDESCFHFLFCFIFLFQTREEIERELDIEKAYLANLNHPNIIRLIGSGQRGLKSHFEPFLVLEYLAGESFSDKGGGGGGRGVKRFLSRCYADRRPRGSLAIVPYMDIKKCL